MNHKGVSLSETIDPPSHAPDQPSQDEELVRSLRTGDERAFQELVKQNYGSMMRLTLTVVGDRSVAEDVIQETWLGALRGLSRFEGRSALKTWLYRILMNRARSAAASEIRRQSLSPSAEDSSACGEQRIPADQFSADGHWIRRPNTWDSSPEGQLLSKETHKVLAQAVEALPSAQRAVFQLRDVEGFSSNEVCDVLELSAVNQRVLLHRARNNVRRSLGEYLERST
jgi:RNA polymerase sigma-70 factor (ECF subfamily)